MRSDTVAHLKQSFVGADVIKYYFKYIPIQFLGNSECELPPSAILRRTLTEWKRNDHNGKALLTIARQFSK